MSRTLYADHWKFIKKKDWPWQDFTPQEMACKGNSAVLLETESMDTLQRLRHWLDAPMRINSAYRSVEYNRKIGGSPNSQHLHGKAFDVSMIKPAPHDMEKFIELAKAAGFKGIGRYYDAQTKQPIFVHLDTGTPRNWIKFLEAPNVERPPA